MIIIGMDPGNERTAYVVYDSEKHAVLAHAILVNGVLRDVMYGWQWIATPNVLFSIEMVACYGMAVGKSVFETCIWTGRFSEIWEATYGNPTTYVCRREVKMYLCNSMRAKDGNVRQAIIDRFEPTGGGKTPQIGVKKQPGPLFGMSKDKWSALGVAMTAAADLEF